MVREISSKKIHSSFSHVRYQGRVMLIENTASLWGTTIRWYNLHKIVVVWVNQSYYYAFILYTLLKNYIIYHQWSCLPLSLYLLFQGLHTDEWALWEGERICFPFSFWRWLSPVPNGAGTVLMSFRSWQKYFFTFLSTINWATIIPVPDRVSSPCLSLQPVWPPGECHKPGTNWSDWLPDIFQLWIYFVNCNIRFLVSFGYLETYLIFVIFSPRSLIWAKIFSTQ